MLTHTRITETDMHNCTQATTTIKTQTISIVHQHELAYSTLHNKLSTKLHFNINLFLHSYSRVTKNDILPLICHKCATYNVCTILNITQSTHKHSVYFCPTAAQLILLSVQCNWQQTQFSFSPIFRDVRCPMSGSGRGHH